MRLEAAAVIGLLAVARPLACESLRGGNAEPECPPCDSLFTQLETRPTGERVQVIHQQERGDPKGSTGVVFDWATKAISHTCDYLKHHFGEESCEMRWFWSDPLTGDAGNCTLIFEPRLGRESARCPCDTIDRVNIVLFNTGKHLLPVDDTCVWSHSNGIAPAAKLCELARGHEVTGYEDLRRCVHDTACLINDDRLQLVVMRDPRAVVVSAYYYNVMYGRPEFKKWHIEEYIVKALPTISQWVAIRYTLFEDIMANRSTVFYYDDMLADPDGFYDRFLPALGLELPPEVVEGMTEAIGHGEIPATVKGIRPHTEATNARRTSFFTDEISPHVLEQMNEVLRVWLPSPLLERFKITP